MGRGSPVCQQIHEKSILKRKIRQRRPRTVAHLKTCLQEEWDKITPETLHHLVSSVPKRLLSVVKRNGNITKW